MSLPLSGRHAFALSACGTRTKESYSKPVTCSWDFEGNTYKAKHSFFISDLCPLNLLGRDLMCIKKVQPNRYPSVALGAMPEDYCNVTFYVYPHKTDKQPDLRFMNNHTTARADLWWWCGGKIPMLPTNWTGVCAVVQLVSPFVILPSPQGTPDPSQAHIHRYKRDIARPWGSFDPHIYLDAIGVPRGVPDEFKLEIRNSVTRALAGLTSLSEELAANSGIDNPFSSWMSNTFGKWKSLIMSVLCSLGVMVGILVSCGCCFIPCARALIERLISTALTKTPPPPYTLLQPDDTFLQSDGQPVNPKPSHTPIPSECSSLSSCSDAVSDLDLQDVTTV